MSRTTSPAPIAPTDDELVESLKTAHAAAKAELDGLEARRVALAARVDSLAHTIAVYSGETPAPKRRASKRRASKRAAADAPSADAPAAA